MTRRIRNILIENSLGKVFTGVDSIFSANASNVIAGTVQQTKGYAQPTATKVVVTNNLGGSLAGIPFAHNGVVVAVQVSVATAPQGSPIIISLKSGTSYSSSTIVGTFSLSALSNTSTTSCSIPIVSGNSFYIDVTQVGKTFSGTGLAVQLNHYLGY